MSRQFKWRTGSSGTEGTTTVFVDSYVGSDVFGEGTRANPYRTLTKAFNAQNTKPTTIVCRGFFSEDLTGNHSCAINGDYLGAAVFDGQNQYMLYGFGHSNLIVKNVPALLSPASPLLAGVGRASHSNFVGLANSVGGLAGSSAVLAGCASYLGVLGCTYSTANKYIVFARPKCNSSYRISIAGYGQNVVSDTFAHCAVTDRQKHYGANMNFAICLFADFAMIANDAGNDNFENCLFTADCRWYYFSGNNTDSNYAELTITGSTSAERQASLLAALELAYDAEGVADGNRKRPVFTNCIFSNQTAAQIFNDSSADDYTIVPGCDADTFVSGLLGDAQYIGALPPALRVPIMDDSTGHAGTWDEKSASGCVVVDDDKICIDPASASAQGEILSKVIRINPLTTQLNGVYAQFGSRFQNYGAYANKNSIFSGTTYGPGDTLPQGRYLVTDPVSYGEDSIGAGEILVVSEDNTSFSSEVVSALALEITEPNVMEVVYCRCRSGIYARVGTNDSLQAGATYLNDSGKTITYHNRSIVDGESFVCMVAGESFSCSADPTATIAVMFDDSRVPTVDWVPAQLFGEYFVAKQGGAIRVDANGVPLSSGNYMSYQTAGLLKSTMDRKYIQFSVKVKRDAPSLV